MSVDDPEKLKTIDPPKTALNYSAAGRPETGKGVAVPDEANDDKIVDVDGDGGEQAGGAALLVGATQSGGVGEGKDSGSQDSTRPSIGDRDGGITSDNSADTSKRVTELETKLAAAMKQIADLRAELAARFDRIEQLLAPSPDQKEFGNPSGIATQAERRAASPSGAPEAVRNAIPRAAGEQMPRADRADALSSRDPANLPKAEGDGDGRGPDGAASPPVVANDLDGLGSNEAHSTASHDVENRAASPSGAPEAVRNAIPTTVTPAADAAADPASKGPDNLPEAADRDGRRADEANTSSQDRKPSQNPSGLQPGADLRDRQEATLAARERHEGGLDEAGAAFHDRGPAGRDQQNPESLASLPRTAEGRKAFYLWVNRRAANEPGTVKDAGTDEHSDRKLSKTKQFIGKAADKIQRFATSGKLGLIEAGLLAIAGLVLHGTGAEAEIGLGLLMAANNYSIDKYNEKVNEKVKHGKKP